MGIWGDLDQAQKGLASGGRGGSQQPSSARRHLPLALPLLVSATCIPKEALSKELRNPQAQPWNQRVKKHRFYLIWHPLRRPNEQKGLIVSELLLSKRN